MSRRPDERSRLRRSMALAMGLDRRDPSPQCTEPVQYALRPSMSPSASRQRRGYAFRIDTGTGVVASCRHPPNGGQQTSHGSGHRPWALVTPDGAPSPRPDRPKRSAPRNLHGVASVWRKDPHALHAVPLVCWLCSNGGSPSRARSRPSADVPSPTVSRLSNSDAPLQKCLLPVPRPRLRTT